MAVFPEIPEGTAFPFAPPVRFGPYTLYERLAYGGASEVFIAAHADQPRRALVLKRLYPHLAAETLPRAAFADEVEAARALNARLTLPVIDAHVAPDGAWLAQPLVPGCSLATVLKATANIASSPLSRRLSIRGVASVVCVIAREIAALKLADGRPVIHRDLSPGNVMLDTTGGVHLIDLGLAYFEGRRHATEQGVVRGTFNYLAPERLRGETASPVETQRKAEVFALAAILREAVVGRPLYADDNDVLAAALRGPDPATFNTAPAADADFEPWRDLLKAALAIDPAERPSPNEFAAAIERVVYTVDAGAPAVDLLPVVQTAAAPLGERLTRYGLTAETAAAAAARSVSARRIRPAAVLIALNTAIVAMALFYHYFGAPAALP